MTGREQGKIEVSGIRDRAQAMTSYARSFFRSINHEDFVQAIDEASASGQQILVEKLYSHKVIDNVVKAILGKIDKGNFLGDQVSDYIQDAAVVVMKIANDERLDLTKSPGEIASYICLWIEQRVKRLARKDQRWRFSLYDTEGDIENFIDITEDPQIYQDDTHDTSGEMTIGIPGAPVCFVTLDIRGKENDILSLFGSSIRGEL